MAYLALDLGAGSGRAIVGTIEDEKIHLKEVHRFINRPVKLNNTLHWNFLALFDDIKEGIRLAIREGYSLDGIAVDTWGVDFGLIDSDGNLISNPVCYRDRRTEGMVSIASRNVSPERFYEITGIQQMDINSVFQLLSLKQANDSALSIADKLLFTPDLINYYLTGEINNEYTIASTSQMLDAKTRTWSKEIFDLLGLPFNIMADIIEPDTCVGKLKADIAEETGATSAKVFAVGSHDTASAIAAIPDLGRDSVFLSSGTWSLLGVLSAEPILTEKAMQNNFTNEGGIDGKILFMKNITGLWLLQRLMAEWEVEDGVLPSYRILLDECEKATPFKCIVNSDDPSFVHPVSMSDAIREYCKDTNQEVPQTRGEFVRCVLESLALKYRFVLDELKSCTGRDIRTLSVVGGGSQNDLLNQFIANSLDIPVTIGLTEATAIGNIMQQAIIDGKVRNWEEGYSIIKNSFSFATYQPKDTRLWENTAMGLKYLFE